MAADVSEFRVFIASPGDLPRERARLRTLEAELNSKFADARIRVRFTGWEEVSPGYGRPQAQINPLVDECDIFIGLLRRRWGTATGAHESGFIEEFERASARRESTGSEPVIALYFAELGEGELNDAGPDLTKVLAFRQKIEKGHVALFSTFASPADVGHQVEDLLDKHLIKILIAQATPSPPEGAPSGGTASDPGDSPNQVGGGRTGEEVDSAVLQISTALDSVRDLLHGRDPEIPLDRDRLEMFGTALGRDAAALGTHLVNRLYRRRHELQLSYAEQACWLRTLLTDIWLRPEPVHRVVPGWEPIKHLGSASLAGLLLQYAMSEGGVGRGALRTLQRLQIRPAELWPLGLGGESDASSAEAHEVATTDTERSTAWVKILNHDPGLGPAMDYLLQDINSTNNNILASTRELLSQLLKSKELNERSRRLIDGARQALEGEPEALADALGYSAEGNAPWGLVLRYVDKLSPKLLNQFARQTLNRPAKLAAIETGLAARTLSDSTLTDLLLLEDDQEVTDILIGAVAGDPDRAQQFLTLIGKREKALTPAETEARLMAVAESPELLRQRQVTAHFSVRPWEALTYSTPDDLVDEAREILRTDAATLRAELAPKLGEEYKRLADFLAGDQRRSAANLLSRRHPLSDKDVELILAWFAQEAENRLLDSAVWRVLARITNDATLPKITDAIRPHTTVLGFRLSLEHLDSPLGPALAAVLIECSTDDAMREQARHWWIKQSNRTDDELREALYAEEDVVRITAAQSLILRMDRVDLTRLQDQYPNAQRTFWYNVVALFDEHLYSPTPSH